MFSKMEKSWFYFQTSWFKIFSRKKKTIFLDAFRPTSDLCNIFITNYKALPALNVGMQVPAVSPCRCRLFVSLLKDLWYGRCPGLTPHRSTPYRSTACRDGGMSRNRRRYLGDDSPGEEAMRICTKCFESRFLPSSWEFLAGLFQNRPPSPTLLPWWQHFHQWIDV